MNVAAIGDSWDVCHSPVTSLEEEWREDKSTGCAQFTNRPYLVNLKVIWQYIELNLELNSVPLLLCSIFSNNIPKLSPGQSPCPLL